MLICGSAPGLMIAGFHTFSRPAMTGLVQDYMFKKKLRNCEPIDVSRFVVDLRDTWILGRLNLMATHVSATAKFNTYNRWCALPPRKAMATYSPYSLPKYMFLDLPRDVICSVARFRLRVHTLRCETVTWNPRSSPACDLCEAEDDVQDEQHFNFHCTHHHVVSLRRRFASLFSETRVQDVFAFLHQNNNKLLFSYN